MLEARKARRAVCAAALMAILSAGTAQADVFARTDVGDSPEGVTTIGRSAFVSTTPVLPWVATGSGEPSTIYRFDRVTGAETGRIVVEGERLVGGVQGIAGLTSEPGGSLLANDAQGRVLRFTEHRDGGFDQETHATVPDLPICAVAQPPCSQHAADLPPLVNEIARLPDGSLLLSDSFQAAVWHVSSAGGEATLLITDERLVGTAFGPNGIAVSPGGRRAVLAVSAGPDGNGALYRFAIAEPELRQIAAYDSEQYPDGIAWVAPRRLYVALSAAGAVALVNPRTGRERRRFNRPDPERAGRDRGPRAPGSRAAREPRHGQRANGARHGERRRDPPAQACDRAAQEVDRTVCHDDRSRRAARCSRSRSP